MKLQYFIGKIRKLYQCLHKIIFSHNEIPNFYINGALYQFSVNSLFIFSDSNRIRIISLKICLSRWFQYFILFNIVLNSISLCFYDYSIRNQIPEPFSIRNYIIDSLEYYFTSLFILEAVLKIIGMGFFLEKGSYLRDAWNFTDFCIVLTGIVAFLPSIPGLSVLRSIRMLRPLRSINKIPGMKMVVSAIIDSIPILLNVGLVLIFFILLFAILGMQAFGDLLFNRCRITNLPLNNTWLINDYDNKICGYRKCFDHDYCGNPIDFGLNRNMSEIDREDFIWGLTNFDNVENSVFTVFESLTGEGWSKILYIFWNGYNAALTSIFFCLVILMGNFFLLNFILAAINNSFIQFERKEEVEKLKHLHQQKLQLSLESGTTPSPATKKYRRARHPHSIIFFEEPSRSKKNCLFHICFMIISNPFFILFSMIMVIINTIILGLDRYPISDKEALYNLDILLGLNIFFAIELTIKFLAFGLRDYIRDKINVIETFAIIVGTTDFFMIFLNDRSNISPKLITTIRNLMLLRIIKLFYFFRSIKLIIRTIKSTLWKMLDFMIIVLLFIFVAALLGMQLFAYNFDKNNTPKLHFNEFDEAFLSVFALLVGDNWNDYMNSAIISQKSDNCRIYYFLIVFLGNLILINVFTAILITTFSEESKRIKRKYRQEKLVSKVDYEKIIESISNKISDNLSFFTPIGKFFKSYLNKLTTVMVKSTSQQNISQIHPNLMKPAPIFKRPAEIMISSMQAMKKQTIYGVPIVTQTPKIESYKKNYPPPLFLSPKATVLNNYCKNSNVNKPRSTSTYSKKNNKIDVKLGQTNPIGKGKRWSILNSSIGVIFSREKRKISELFFADESQNSIFMSIERNYRNNIVDFKEFNEKVKNYRRSNKSNMNLSNQYDNLSILKAQNKLELQGTSLIFFKSDSQFRKILASLLESSIYRTISFFFIFLCFVVKVFDEPLIDPNSSFNKFMMIFDILVALFWTFEMIINIMVFGFFFNGRKAYLKSNWNKLDFIVSIIFIFSTFEFLNGDNSTFKWIKFARIIRLIRLIPKKEGLKIAINSFLKSLPNLFNLIFLVFSFFYICAVFLVANFKGTFYSCEKGILKNVIRDKWECFDYGGDWINKDFNFDHTGLALSTLLSIATTDGWVNKMFIMVSAVDINIDPIENYSEIWKIFMIVYVSLSTFMVLNLFTSLVVNSYQKEKDKEIGIANLTMQQKDWIKLQTRIFRMSPEVLLKIPKNKIRRVFYHIVKSKIFHTIVWINIIINSIIFCIPQRSKSMTERKSLEILNLFLFTIMLFENLFKFICYGHSYFSKGWHLFDLSLIILTTMTYNMGSLIESVGVSPLSLHTLRLFRLTRLFEQFQTLKTILNTLISSFSSLAHIGGLLLFVLFIYAIVGMNAFGFVRFQENINDDANFTKFQISFMTLLRISTGEDWSSLMSDYARNISPNFWCFNINSYDEYLNKGIMGCGSNWSYLFFLSFEIIFKMIVLNLFIAVIINSFEEYSHRAAYIINDLTLSKFNHYWKMFDKNGVGIIEAKEFKKFIGMLYQPLGLHNENILFFCKKTGIPIYRFKYSKTNQLYIFYYDLLLACCKKTILEYENGVFEDNLEPQNEVKIVQNFFKTKLKSLEKIKNLIVTQYTILDYIAIKNISKFLFKNRHLLKIKFKENLNKKLICVDLPSPPPLKKGNSRKKIALNKFNIIENKLNNMNSTIFEEKDSEIFEESPQKLKKISVFKFP